MAYKEWRQSTWLGKHALYFFFAMKLPQGGVEVWKGLCCPRSHPCKRCIPGAYPGQSLMGGRTGAKEAWMCEEWKGWLEEGAVRFLQLAQAECFTTSQNYPVFLIHSKQHFCADLRGMWLNCFPASGGKMTCGSCTVLAKSLSVWRKAFPTLGLLANEEKMLGRGKASLQGRGHGEESFANLSGKGCSCGTISCGETSSACLTHK